ncbi:MAG TPA: ATP-dependent zinc metalloprotease FtsH [Gemmatimonadales bacterium]|nr:ATP-dependent zinc metalloprotease FtsH [Gemmatimonadales bacterium]
MARVEIAPDEHVLQGSLRRIATIDGRGASRFRTVLPFIDPATLVARLHQKGVPIEGKLSSSPWSSALVALLPWLLIGAFWFFILRQMRRSGAQAFAFGHARTAAISPETPKVTFADVADVEEAKAELQEIIAFLKAPERFQRLGGRLPKGVLLVGPPGTGKTLLARATAGEAGRPFLSISGSDFVELFVGVGAARVRDLFAQGKASAPCIIFIDEIDAVGRHRGAGLGGGHDEREQTLNQLLVEMDGFESNDGVILIAATNRPDVLDPALLRPGRFDRQIVVDSPDVKGREGILRVHARKIPLAPDVDLGIVAKGTPGMAGADLANLVNEAALLAARAGKQNVSMDDFESAKDKVMLGVERRSLVLTDHDKKITAYHEAGHAVVAMKTPGSDPVHKVTIIPRGRALGLTASLPETDRHNYTRDWLIGSLAMFFGGRAAEELVFGRGAVTTGAGNDIERATSLARRMVTQFGMSDAIGLMAVGEREQEVFLGREFGSRREVSEQTAQLVDAEVKRLIDEAYATAVRLLTEHRDLLERITEALLERETIDREDLALLEKNLPLPPRPTPPPMPPAPPVADTPRPEAPAMRAPILGAPPAEPAGA